MQTQNTGILEFAKLISPEEIRSQIPISEKATNTILNGRKTFQNILEGKDSRFVVITGPCSIHNPESAIEYAEKLKALSNELSDKIFIIMRAYFEKPRTTVGWKGLISDPYLNGTEDMEAGIRMARKILVDIAELELPAATELLDPITAAYLGELVSWVAIGARTTESQTHRQMASGLSAPVGFKNNSDGNLDVAVNAMTSATAQHSFIGVNDAGECCIVRTKGNPSTHIILRGGAGKSNYHPEDIAQCEAKLAAQSFAPKIIVDCSHENSGKDYRKQGTVLQNLIAQKESGNTSIFGAMLEGHLKEGNQKIPNDLSQLEYGVSITDSCVSWEETENLLRNLHKKL